MIGSTADLCFSDSRYVRLQADTNKQNRAGPIIVEANLQDEEEDS